MNKLITSLGGKKFLSAVVGLVTVMLVSLLGDRLSLSEEQVHDILWAVLGIVGLFNVGQGVADGLSGGKTSHVANGNGK